MNLKQIRALHLYLGLLFAPSLIFFSFSGALQLFGFHEARGSSPAAPRWIVALANVHKDQKILDAPRAERPAPESKPAPSKARPSASDGGQQSSSPRHQPSLALKWFFLLAAAGLASTSVMGIVMAFQYNRDRRLIWTLLVAGTLLPLALLFLS